MLLNWLYGWVDRIPESWQPWAMVACLVGFVAIVSWLIWDIWLQPEEVEERVDDAAD